MNGAEALADAGFPIGETSDSPHSSHRSRSTGLGAVGGGGPVATTAAAADATTPFRPHRPRLYCERWTVLVGYCALVMAAQVTFVLTLPVAEKMASFYGVSAPLMDALALAFVVSYAPAMVWVPWVLTRMELYRALLLGASLQCLGAWLSVGGRAPGGVAFVALGHTLAAAGGPLVMNCLATVPQMWFGTHERPLATALGYIASVVGVGGGIMLSVALTPDAGSVPSALLASGGIVTALLVGFLLLFRRRPWSPPTGSAATQLEDERLRAGGRPWAPPPHAPVPPASCSALGAAARDVRWASCAVSYSLVAGTVLAWARVGGRLMRATGHGDEFTAGLGILFLASGIVGTIVAALVVGFVFAFKRVLGALGAAAAMSACLFAWQVRVGLGGGGGGGAHTAPAQVYPDAGLNAEDALNVLVCCVGFALMPLAPVALELCAETAYPTREFTSTGALRVCVRASAAGMRVSAHAHG